MKNVLPVLITVMAIISKSLCNNEEAKSYKNCYSEAGVTGILNCGALRLLKSLERMNSFKEMQLLPGVTLLNTGNSSSRSPKSIWETLPKEATKKTDKLFDLILDSGTQLLSGKTLKIDIPKVTPQNLARALVEGRGKMKKGMNNFMLGFGGTMITMIPIMMGGLAFLASKAMLIGKIAFILTTVMFVQTLFSSQKGWSGYNYLGSYGPPSYSGTYGTPFYGTNNIGWNSGPYSRSLHLTQEEEKNQESTTANTENLVYAGYK